jgi:hypothetical protein
MFRSSLGLFRGVALVGLLAGAVLLAGCSGGKKGSKVSGTVTYNNAPVTGGKLILTPTSGSAITLEINGLGEFKGQDVPVGTYKVSITTKFVQDMTGGGAPVMPADQVPKDFKSKMPKDNAPPPGPAVLKKVEIPAKYEDPNTSGETWEIKKGENKREFALKD